MSNTYRRLSLDALLACLGGFEECGKEPGDPRYYSEREKRILRQAIDAAECEGRWRLAPGMAVLLSERIGRSQSSIWKKVCLMRKVRAA